MRLDSTEATVSFDNLVIEAGDAGTIQLEAGQGVLVRGSVIDNAGKLFKTGATPYGVLQMTLMLLTQSLLQYGSQASSLRTQ